MAGIVENNVVKMEWNKAQWLETAGKKRVFIFAGKTYESTTHGTVDVLFNASMAFIFASNPLSDEEDLWDADNVIDFYKRETPGNFPFNFEECVTVMDSDSDEPNMSILEHYGIVDAKDDIKARLADIAPYGYEEEVKMF